MIKFNLKAVCSFLHQQIYFTNVGPYPNYFRILYDDPNDVIMDVIYSIYIILQVQCIHCRSCKLCHVMCDLIYDMFSSNTLMIIKMEVFPEITSCFIYGIAHIYELIIKLFLCCTYA